MPLTVSGTFPHLLALRVRKPIRLACRTQTTLYSPSHPGRLIHVELAGPFLPSIDGGRRYALII
eukprot:2590002-Pleurochrysis_carterae.AAC.1